MGSPAYRRRFLDIHISQQDIPYLKSLQRYNKVLQSRNRILKDIKTRKSSKIELEYWTEKLIQDGIKISKIRNKKLLQISEETLKNISQLSKLGIHDDTKEKLIKELESILEMVNKMNEVNTEYVEPMSHPMSDSQNLREDLISSDIKRDDYMENAPLSEDGYYLTPKVIEQDD